MIDINDYNKDDIIASCLIEAASVLQESGLKLTGNKIDMDKLNSLDDKHKEMYRELFKGDVRQIAEAKRHAAETVQKEENDRKLKDIGQRYEALLTKQEARRAESDRRLKKPLTETSYTDDVYDRNSWKLYANGRYIGTYSSPKEREALINKYESRNK